MELEVGPLGKRSRDSGAVTSVLPRHLRALQCRQTGGLYAGTGAEARVAARLQRVENRDMQPELVRRLRLEQVIVHRVPSAADVGSVPRFSDVPAPPSGSVTAYFEQRVSGVMGDQGVEIEPDDEAESATRDAILAILRDPARLAEQSRLIGQRLYNAQDRRNPEGIAVVGVGKIDDLPAVAVLKLEHERGVTAEERELANGQFMFELVVHDDLMLTERTVLFKCAVFKPNNDNDWRLEGVAADLQVRGVAA